MSKSVRSNMWFFRITAPWEHIKSKVPDMMGWIDYSGCVIGYHEPDKEDPARHAHVCIVLRSTLQKQSFDSRIKKLFDVAGNAQFCNKVWDGNLGKGAVSYMFHDPKAEIQNHIGMTDEQMATAKYANDIIQEQIKEAKEKSSHKVIDYVMNKISESGKMDKYEILHCIIKAVYDRQFYYPGDFQLSKYIDEIMIRQTMGDEKELLRLTDDIASRLPTFRK